MSPRRGRATLAALATLAAVSLLATGGSPAVRAQPLAIGSAPAAGRLLVARETLLDPNFVHTVVLLVEADSEGVVGLVVNRPTEMPVERVLAGAETIDEPVWVGGPVEPERVSVLVRSDEALPGTVPVIAGVRLGGTLEMIESAVEDGLPFRVLSGYSGWSRGQLDHEIGRGSWYVLEADEAHVFADDPEALWQRLSERASAPWARRGGRADGETLVAP